MKYTFDHDFHIHSKLSLCSNDPEQNAERILRYASENGLKQICVTDHFWDSTVDGASGWYKQQDFEHISSILPLPQGDGIKFMFGAETDMDKFMTLGTAKQTFDKFDFVIIPTTHLHMKGFTISEEDAATPESRAKVWLSRLSALLDMDLPFQKIGIAHLACGLIAPTREEYLRVLELLPSEKLEELFAKCAKVGVGIELNFSDMSFADSEADTVLRMFKIAKEQGCKFYLGCDAHHPKGFEKCKAVFERAIDLLGLTEDDKFRIN